MQKFATASTLVLMLTSPLSTAADDETAKEPKGRAAAPLVEKICQWVAADDSVRFSRAMGNIQRAALQRKQFDMADHKLSETIRCDQESLRDYAESVEAHNILLLLSGVPNTQLSSAQTIQ